MAIKREFLTTDEVAEILGISAFTIRRYIQSRKLRAVRLEASYRIRTSDLERFIKSRQVGSREESERSAKTGRGRARRKATKAASRSKTHKPGMPAGRRRARHRPVHPA
ncbi:MAG: helix-turn-helix domain-containing protein [Chloroflexi bacterium]|nr:helix-turn-helix domain-containing protein [Chloroflexota bacterium]